MSAHSSAAPSPHAGPPGPEAPRSGTVAVLGATGCVGRQVCVAFERAGREVLGIARNRGDHPPRDAFTAFDVAGGDPAELAGLLTAAGVDTVVNATGGWVLTEEAMHESHVLLVERLLGATALMAVRPRVVQLGTIHEYGFADEGVSIDESFVPDPVTPYARTKHAGSAAVLAATAAGEADGVVLRPVNLCGPHTPEASFLGALMARIAAADPREGLELTLADARRDYLDVRDLAAAVLAAAHAPVSGRVINLGRGEAVPMREIVALVVAASGFPADAVRERTAEVQSKGGNWTRADISLAGELLDWRPRIGLRDSLRDMWAVGPGRHP
ncbi:NAD-dependent epimerase [Streptomyces sp. ZEA17I]|uniref:NAD-dependent epimerase/dehydratase family protein n=1 Tax=Streptomyces sp. ZEA17I TaxID=2202516 RepID=UPI000D7029E1|nr:NAD(P)-dependent oxidoreductase [Streptomyces sp. ZEA17I]PWS39764.1 NAD-dependent epimerase [Streptomyces sp. ZEA17I]